METDTDSQKPADPPSILDETLLTDLFKVLGMQSLQTLITTFDRSAQENLYQLEQAFDASDTAALASVSHSLKGSAGNLGLIEIGNIAAKMEISALSGRVQETADVLQSLPGALDRAKAAVAAFLSRLA